MSIVRVAVDLMGSDSSPQLLFEGVSQVSREVPLVVLGTEEALASLPPHSLETIVTPEYITMEDHPLRSVRSKKGSTIHKGIELLDKGAVRAFVSAGNTGALIASAALFLSPLPGIERPGLLTVIPTAKKPLVVLDVGGNVTSQASHLVQYAEIGASFSRKLMGVETPQVALLNIGTEAIKGREEHKKAYEILSTKKGQYQFIGNIEGKQALTGAIDVLVTDGFTGNVFLKAIEGAAGIVVDVCKVTDPAVRKIFHHQEYPGAVMIGVEGVVIKAHGDVTPTGFAQSIRLAKSLI